ncbi:hypothetical protein [Campylobacter cuniculorum]|uniref:Uncharacterized protein n=2 Tax=Campylobacter cuniculorum TaxID=374106 RepID=A0A1W6BX89_9BACT|nr:hypothetical protein [Campylobacter cuniculorum]ARJ56688.1 hypothetical protein CCUN_1091 [Campylobacter cuniculorum DSM 23162 = LMG 24588]QOR04163.1 hypothetical protein A0071_08370 [Campylobacter cuniculorum]
MAVYGYFDLIDKRFETKKVENTSRQSTPIITYTDILDNTYNKYIAVELNPRTNQYEKIGKLNGDFSPFQAKQFFSRYDLLKHCPNTDSGFSATLFYDKEKDKFIIGFRGTE